VWGAQSVIVMQSLEKWSGSSHAVTQGRGCCLDAAGAVLAKATLVAVLLGIAAPQAGAGDRLTIRLWNIGGQAGITLASAAFQHKIHGWHDMIRIVTAGSASGLGMYEAKSIVGKGHPRSGWILANVAGSLSENAAAGRHPLGQIGYTVGPLRVRVSMPRFGRGATSWIAAEMSIYQTVALVDAISAGGTPRVRDGLIAFDRALRSEDQHIGVTSGVFPSVFVPDQIVWLHEFTHAVQSLQIEVAEPPNPWRKLRFDRPPTARRRLFAFEHIKIGMFNFANSVYTASRPYEKRWPETEAFQLTAPSDPSR
jgi:hypothetical protein